VNLQQFILILQARWRIVVGTLGVTVAVALLVSLILPNQYTATTSVVVDVKSPDPIAGIVLPAMAMPGYMATQVDIINSDRVAQNVVKMLKLDQNPQAIASWKEATEGKGRIEVWLSELLEKKLDVKPSRESNVISISFKASDPVFAAAVANGFAQAYIEANIDLRADPAKQYATWFEQQSKVLRDRLGAAQGKLSAYQQAHGIVATDERLNFENQKLNELQTQLVLAETQVADASSKENSGDGDTVQEVMQNPVVLQLRADIDRMEAKLQESGGNLGKNHPQYIRQQAEIASLKQKLANETAQINTSLATSNRVGRGKAVELKAALETHKKRILEIKQQHDEISVLEREVESAQKDYEVVSQRYTQSNLESRSTQTNVSVLTPASEPIVPSSPKIVLNTLLSIFLGSLLGVGSAFVLELLDRRIRAAEDFEVGLGIPVLATISAPPEAKPAFRLWRKPHPA
jgi:succinoglycan biosynthesis transport protein ExoP